MNKITQQIETTKRAIEIALDLNEQDVCKTITWLLTPQHLFFNQIPYEICLQGEGNKIEKFLTNRGFRRKKCVNAYRIDMMLRLSYQMLDSDTDRVRSWLHTQNHPFIVPPIEFMKLEEDNIMKIIEKILDILYGEPMGA